MQHHTTGGPDPGRYATRYWQIRTLLEIVKFTAWALFFTGWVLVQIGWEAIRGLI